MASVLDPTLPRPTMPTLTSCISSYDISGISWSCRVARRLDGGRAGARRSGRNPSVRDGNPDSEAEPSRNFWNLRFSDDSDLPNCLGTESALIGTRQLACGAHTSALGVFKNGSIIRP